MLLWTWYLSTGEVLGKAHIILSCHERFYYYSNPKTPYYSVILNFKSFKSVGIWKSLDTLCIEEYYYIVFYISFSFLTSQRLFRIQYVRPRMNASTSSNAYKAVFLIQDKKVFFFLNLRYISTILNDNNAQFITYYKWLHIVCYLVNWRVSIVFFRSWWVPGPRRGIGRVSASPSLSSSSSVLSSSLLLYSYRQVSRLYFNIRIYYSTV